MTGRDPYEEHRVATPLELLFDLTFVISFGVAASQLAHALSEGHLGTGLLGFGIAGFAICWAWTNFSWFSSAYDTDDWLFRVVTMVQMSGVLVLGLGLPRMFASIEHGAHLDAGMMVAGYVIMRLAMVFQWLRAAWQDPARREATWIYAIIVSAVQIGWVALVALAPPFGVALALYVLLGLGEVAAPMLAERRTGTPWHAHHIAERYSLFAIIALGEGIVGTVAALSAVVADQGWTLDAALACIAGMGLTFGMWWVYYMLPSAEILHHHRNRAFPWAYGQLAIITAIVATGAGLHVAAYFIEHKAHIGALATILCVALPVGIFLAVVYALYAYLVRRFDPFHFWLLLATMAVIILAVVAAANGVGMTTCLLIVTLAPLVTVIGYELLGHRHKQEVLAEQAVEDPKS
ncbi:low temperature requirement protein A [Sphingomonas sp. JC676]|nr:low temperature requirement protein A [Sphingomonas sp. JC676]